MIYKMRKSEWNLRIVRGLSDLEEEDDDAEEWNLNTPTRLQIRKIHIIKSHFSPHQIYLFKFLTMALYSKSHSQQICSITNL
ncbi:hypothetical protein HYC85_007867 [Camellia sinensis]|uniref:Uncharacterized protein n=1 Tax=Camellia sinensis TaxID=4442 RepID=A0A7J7HS19_CAMSI|nr:hypothetical protein HYC85_007867 [Camellia sinensis]